MVGPLRLQLLLLQAAVHLQRDCKAPAVTDMSGFLTTRNKAGRREREKLMDDSGPTGAPDLSTEANVRLIELSQ